MNSSSDTGGYTKNSNFQQSIGTLFVIILILSENIVYY